MLETITIYLRSVLEELGPGISAIASRKTEVEPEEEEFGCWRYSSHYSSAPRGSWLLGKVFEVFYDKKGLVCSVKLQTKNNMIERPVTKLCLM